MNESQEQLLNKEYNRLSQKLAALHVKFCYNEDGERGFANGKLSALPQFQELLSLMQQIKVVEEHIAQGNVR